MRPTRVHETPNAVMTTLASPSLDGADLAVWRIEMASGSAGPVHTVDTEQVLVVIDGKLAVTIGAAEEVLSAGEALTVPAHASRQVRQRGGAPTVVLAASLPDPTATAAGRDPVAIPWAR